MTGENPGRGNVPVVELRVHGVGGPSAAEVLDTSDPIPRDGAGQTLAGFFGREEKGPDGQDVEAFIWGGLTSRSAVQALWWVLLPFSLINVAGWMVYAERDEDRDPSRRDAGRMRRPIADWMRNNQEIVPLRGLIRWAGVLMTMVYVLWTSVIVLDIGSYQCGREVECVNRSWLLPLRWFSGNDLWRISVGGLVLFIAFVLLLYAGRLTHRRYEEYEPDPVRRSMARDPHPVRRNDNLRHPRFWYNWEEWYRSFRTHGLWGGALCAGLVAYAVSFAAEHGESFETGDDGASLVWSIILGVVAFAALAWVLRPPIVDDKGEMREDRFGRMVTTLLSLTAALGAGAVAGWLAFDLRKAERVVDLPLIPDFTLGALDAAPLEGGLGFPTAVSWLFAIEVVGLLFGALFVVKNNWHRIRWSRIFDLTPPVGDRFRLLAPAVAVVTGFAIASAGFGAVVIRLVDYLDRTGDAFKLGSAESGHVASPGLAVDIFVVAFTLGLAATALPMVRGLLNQYTPGVAADFPHGEAGFTPFEWAKFKTLVARTRLVSQLGRNVDRFLSGFTVGVLLAGMYVIWRAVRYADTVKDFDLLAQPLLGIGGTGEMWTDSVRAAFSWALLLYVFPGVLIIRASGRDRGARRQVGKVWDSITFFPRRFHPLGAPCYAERAVPMLREYLREQVAAGKRVVVRAHSQGTVLAVAAVSQLVGEGSDPREVVTMTTEQTGLPEDYRAVVPQVAEQMLPAARGAEAADESTPESAEALAPRGAAVLGRVALITLGSPLGQLHAPFFPDYFSQEEFMRLRGPVADAPHLGGRWQSFYRETDYIGKAIFVDPEIGLTIHGTFHRNHATGSSEVPADWARPDGRPPPPDNSLVDPSEPLGEMRRHSEYDQEPEVVAQISEFVRELRSAPSSESAAPPDGDARSSEDER